jgi:hypothetical protein
LPCRQTFFQAQKPSNYKKFVQTIDQKHFTLFNPRLGHKGLSCLLFKLAVRSEQQIIIVDRKKWLKAFNFACFALTTVKNVQWLVEPFRTKLATEPRVADLPIGTFITQFDRELLDKAEDLGLQTIVSSESITSKTIFLRQPRIALFADAGSPFPFASVLAKAGMKYSPLSASEIRGNRLKDYNIFIIPGGGDGGPMAQAELLGKEGKQAVKNFVRQGGGVWGSCAGCINIVQISKQMKELGTREFGDWSSIGDMELINAEYWSVGESGVGRLLVENLLPTHPVMFGLPSFFEMTWHLGPLISRAKTRLEGASRPVPLLRVKNFTKHWTAAEYVYAQEKQFEEGGLDKTYVGRGIAEGRVGVMVGRYGSGRVCASGGHPEFGLDPLLEKWGKPAKMLLNFVLWATSFSRQNLYGTSAEEMPAKCSSSDWVIKSRIFLLTEKKISALRTAIKSLTGKASGFPPEWFADNEFPATFGLTGSEKWPIVVKRLCELPNEIARANMNVYRLALEAERMLLYLKNELLKTNAPKRRQHASWITIERVKKEICEQFLVIKEDYVYGVSNFERENDYGWQGVLILLESALNKIKKITSTKPSPEEKVSLYSTICDWYLGALYDLINALTVLQARQTFIIEALKSARTLNAGIKRRKQGTDYLSGW